MMLDNLRSLIQFISVTIVYLKNNFSDVIISILYYNNFIWNIKAQKWFCRNYHLHGSKYVQLKPIDSELNEYNNIENGTNTRLQNKCWMSEIGTEVAECNKPNQIINRSYHRICISLVLCLTLCYSLMIVRIKWTNKLKEKRKLYLFQWEHKIESWTSQIHMSFFSPWFCFLLFPFICATLSVYLLVRAMYIIRSSSISSLIKQTHWNTTKMTT